MNTKKIGGGLILITAAFIWGFAFVAQSQAMDTIGPLTMNGLRCMLAAVFLVPVVIVSDLIKKKTPSFFGTQDKAERRSLIEGGLLCGLFLTVASTVQQIGIQYTTVGKAGFLTALYIIIVPLLGLAFGKKTGINVWVSVIIAFVGMYLLFMTKEKGVNLGDVLMLVAALFFSFHILVIDKYASLVDGIRMSCIQFFICGVTCCVLMFIYEKPDLNAIRNTWFPIFFAGIMSGGVAYTLQIIGQRIVPPSVAPLLLSLEAVFSALGGWIVLGERLSRVELIGCALMFAATIIAQVDFKRLFAKNRKSD